MLTVSTMTKKIQRSCLFLGTFIAINIVLLFPLDLFIPTNYTISVW